MGAQPAQPGRQSQSKQSLTVPPTPHSPQIEVQSLPHLHKTSRGGGAGAADETRPFLGGLPPQLLAMAGQPHIVMVAPASWNSAGGL